MVAHTHTDTHSDNLKLDSVAKNNFRILTQKLHKALYPKLKVSLQNLKHNERARKRVKVRV